MRMLSVLFSSKEYLHVYYIFQMRNSDMKSIGGLKRLYFVQETKKIEKNIYILEGLEFVFTQNEATHIEAI